MTRLVVTGLFMGLVSGCSPGSVASLTTVQSAPSTSSSFVDTTTTSTTTVPTTTTTTLSPPITIDPQSPSVWFAPNMGSVDFPELFTHPEDWAAARDQVDVFQFYGNTVSGFPYDIGGDNILSTFVEADAFRRLQEWGIATALELGVVKFFACQPDSWVEYADLTIGNIEANGGRVSLVAMDEPLLGGQLEEGGQTCGYTMEETAAVVADYIGRVVEGHPDTQVGNIEAYPHYSEPQLEQWLKALEDAGAKPAFFHLDVDIERTRAEGQNVAADLRRLRDFTMGRDIPFGVILTSNWTSSGTDADYYQSTIAWVDTVNQAMGRPTHAIFQSWMGPAPSGLHEVPINLPEDDPAVFSHTRLILEGLEVLG